MTESANPRISEALDYVFRDPSLLRVALTHRSHASEHLPPRGTAAELGGDNERLEYLGDAVLSMVIADLLWRRVPLGREGELSQLRAAVVNEGSLAEAALRARIPEGLRLGRGEDRTGGRMRPSILADAIEAVFAAVYLDGGLEAARGVILRLLSERVEQVLSQGVRDDKSALQVLLQARHKITPRYEVVATYGPDHEREHEVELRAGDVVAAKGRGRSKKDAEQDAARVALALLAERARERSERAEAAEAAAAETALAESALQGSGTASTTPTANARNEDKTQGESE